MSVGLLEIPSMNVGKYPLGFLRDFDWKYWFDGKIDYHLHILVCKCFKSSRLMMRCERLPCWTQVWVEKP
jgi:hypothetical protein